MKFPVYLHKMFLRKSAKSRVNSELELKLFSKRSVFTNLFFVDRRIQIYNGSKFVNLTFSREMLNHKLVNFVLQSE